MSRNLGKHDEGTGDYVFVELITRIPSHCIEVCYKRTRKTMKLMSYAVYGDHCYVSHATTEHNRKQYGIDRPHCSSSNRSATPICQFTSYDRHRN